MVVHARTGEALASPGKNLGRGIRDHEMSDFHLSVFWFLPLFFFCESVSVGKAAGVRTRHAHAHA